MCPHNILTKESCIKCSLLLLHKFDCLCIILMVTNIIIRLFPQTSECGTIAITAHELRLDNYTLYSWRFDSIEALFPAVHKATLYICRGLRVDHLDILQLPALKELCLKKDPDTYYVCKFTEWTPLCERLCSSFSRLEKVAFISLPIGDHHAGRILSSLREHSNLAEIR